MKKLSKKAAALLMSLCLGTTLCPVTGVSAAQSDDVCSAISQAQIEPRYSYIDVTSVSFYSTGSFRATVRGISGVVESVKITVELEKKVLFWYSTGESLTKTYVGSSGSYVDSFDLDSSGTYRIKVTFEVFTANDSESVVKYAEI